jgi:transcriptional regulator with XRE-family HTH domain
MSTFGQRIKLLRERKNLTQKELADSLTVNRDALAKWETDRAFPDLTVIKEMADFFKVTTDYLLCGDTSAFQARIMETLRQTEGLLSKEEEQFLTDMIVN